MYSEGMSLLRLLWIPVLLLLMGCPSTPTGNLQISVTGLPTGVSADITVTGPNYSKKLTAATNLTDLGLGSYTLTVAEVSQNTTAYLGVPASQTVEVVSGGTASANVAYIPKMVSESANNDNKTGALLLQYGQTANATIETGGDQDWYKFVAQAGDFVKIDVDARTLNAAWGSGDGANGVILELYTSSTAPPSFMAQSDSTSTIAALSSQYDPPGDSVVTQLLTQAETYYVRAYGRFGNVGSLGHQYALKLSKTAVPWSSGNMRVVGGHLKDRIALGVSVLANAVVDIYEPGGDFNPTGRFNYSVSGPAGWNGGNPYSGNVEFFGHQVAIVFTKDADVSATALSEAMGFPRGISVAQVEPLQNGSYTVNIEVHGKTLTKTFGINSADALSIPQNINVVPSGNAALKVSWNAVAGAKKYVIFVVRPNGSMVRETVIPPTTQATVQLFNPMQTGEKYGIQVYVHDFNYLVDILGGKYNKSGDLSKEFTYIAP
jgi:hypothetical protein